jgi:hypothetical protein
MVGTLGLEAHAAPWTDARYGLRYGFSGALERQHGLVLGQNVSVLFGIFGLEQAADWSPGRVDVGAGPGRDGFRYGL